MHGQVKVRRSPEQAAELRQMKAEASRKFIALSDEVLAMRDAREYNVQILEKLAQLCESVPDMFTLWNYRREILLNCNTSADEVAKLYGAELTLTSQCLMKNPKSYAVWAHRTWVMKNHPKPDWQAERELCSIALKVDERNFHCWDYRRFVVNNSNVPNTEELEFVNSVLENNFSNYSAWHHRSTLVGADDEVATAATPVSPPPSLGCDKKSTELPFDELDLVHNAIFTDPKDQGPWFYYWWLLSRGDNNSYLRELYLSRSLQRAVLVFTSPKMYCAISHLKVDVLVSDPEKRTQQQYTPQSLGGWQCALPGVVSAVWWFELPKDLIDGCNVRVKVHTEDDRDTSASARSPIDGDESKTWLDCSMGLDQKESLTRMALDPRRLLNFMVSPTHEPSSLDNELDIVRELVSLEPRSKWALLTLVSLLRYIRPYNCSTEIEVALRTLQTVDAHRMRYYTDMASAHATEDALVSSFSTNSRSLDLSGVGLSRICCLDWCTLMTDIDFSNNQLDYLPATFAYLVCLKDLKLDDNQISSLKPIAGLAQLKRVSVRNNRISTFEGLEPALSCINLRDLDITDNSVADLPHFTKLLADHPGSKRSHNSLSVTYNRPVST